MVELAGAFGYETADASFTGPCRNPWNVDHWSGGSSTGPAAAIAAGLVAVRHRFGNIGEHYYPRIV